MKKIKGVGKLTKMIATKIANHNRRNFSKHVRASEELKKLLIKLTTNQNIKLQLVSFSSSKDFEEQILSILSFVQYIGYPISWTIYSDGSHTKEEISIAQEVFSFVRIVKLPFDKSFFDNLNDPLQSYKLALGNYARNHALGKKICSYLNHSIEGTTIFLDSDIVFYSGSSIIKDLILRNEPGWFLVDPASDCLHSQYIQNNKAENLPVNAGFLVSGGKFDNINTGLAFLESVHNNYEYFTEQTVIHIISHNNAYVALDPKLFIVNTADQFDFSYTHDRCKIAIRHYTGPVRHKMWQRNWKWHLSLS